MSMRYLCFLNDLHAGYHDARLVMRKGIVDQLSSLARAELGVTFRLLRAAVLWCSSRPSGAADMGGLVHLAIDFSRNSVA
jgi:hypothetical protein